MQISVQRRLSRHSFVTLIFTISTLLLVVVLGQASATDEPADVIPLQTADVWLERGAIETGGHRYMVLKLTRNLREAEVHALSDRGIQLLSYLGDGAFIAGVDSEALTREVATSFGIKSAAPWQAQNKASLAIRQGNVPSYERTDAGSLKLFVTFFDDVQPQQIEAILKNHARQYKQQLPNLWSVEVSQNQLDDLLLEEGVHKIEVQIPETTELNNSRAIIHADEVQKAVIDYNKPAIRYDGLAGKGIILQVSETVWDGHPDFEDQASKSRFYNPSPQNGSPHGTYVAGIMGGNGMLSQKLHNSQFFAPVGTWRGIAPEATLYDDRYNGYRSDGSFGVLIDAANYSKFWFDTIYNSSFEDMDRSIRGLHGRELRWPSTFAGGNHQKAEQGQDGYYSIYSPAKNVISVGGVHGNDGSLWTGSSLGPTLDGRIKPDIMAASSASYVPKEHDLDSDPVTMTIDYIHIYDLKTKRNDRAWDFNTAGDLEGWFVNGGNIQSLEASGKHLIIRFIGPYSKITIDNLNLGASEHHVIKMRYKITAPSGPFAGHGGFSWCATTPCKLGWLSIRTEPSTDWVDGVYHVGRFGHAHKFEITTGGWRGTIDRLDFNPYFDNYGVMNTHWEKRGATFQDKAYYSFGPGTSIAAPAVTGGIALMMQQMRDYHQINLSTNAPLPSTVKAILIHTADDMVHTTADPRDPDNTDTGEPVLYYEGPDFATGYGLSNIKAAVDFITADPGPGAITRLMHESKIDGYERHVYEMVVTEEDFASAGGELKVTLVWDDFPADSTTWQDDPKLVNDLDLMLIAPNGWTFLPWTLDPLPLSECATQGKLCDIPDPIFASDIKPAWRAADHLNNVEMIEVDRVIPGRWLLVVTGSSVPMPKQSYSLVANQPFAFSETVNEANWGLREDWEGYINEGAPVLSWHVADLDGDGGDELLQPWDNNGRLGMFTYAWNGNNMELIWYTGDTGKGSDALDWLVADLDGDGSDELLQPWANGTRLAFIIYEGKYQMYEKWSTDSMGSGWLALDLLIADIDGDGEDEILHLWNNDGTLALLIYEWQTDKLVTKWYTDDMGQGSPAEAWLIADVDGDGKEEMLQPWNNNGRLGLIIYAWQNGQMETKWASEDMLQGYGAVAWRVADVDGDGQDEWVQLWSNDGRLGMVVYGWKGKPMLSMWGTQNIGQEAVATDWLVLDLTGDGRQELLQPWLSGLQYKMWLYGWEYDALLPKWLNVRMTEEFPAWAWLAADVDGDGQQEALRLWNDYRQRLYLRIYSVQEPSYKSFLPLAVD